MFGHFTTLCMEGLKQIAFTANKIVLLEILDWSFYEGILPQMCLVEILC